MGGHTVELDDVPVCIGQLPVLHMESAVLSEGGSVSAGCAPDASEDDVCSEEAVLSEMVSVMAADVSGEADVVASFDVSCLPQPARAQVPKAASTAQLSVFLKIDIITSFLIRVRESTNENTNNGLPFKTKKQALTTNIIIVSVKLGKK